MNKSHWEKGYIKDINNKFIIDNNIDSDQKIIILIIMSFAYQENKELSHSYIGKILNKHPDTISAKIKDLINKKYIKIKTKFVRSENKGASYVILDPPRKNRVPSPKKPGTLPEKTGYPPRKNQDKEYNINKNINKVKGQGPAADFSFNYFSYGSVDELKINEDVVRLLEQVKQTKQQEWIKQKGLDYIKSILADIVIKSPKAKYWHSKAEQHIDAWILRQEGPPGFRTNSKGVQWPKDFIEYFSTHHPILYNQSKDDRETMSRMYEQYQNFMTKGETNV